MRRRNGCALALALAALLALATVAAAAPGDDERVPWRVSATVTGTYENATGWVACFATGESALVRETATVDVRLRPRFTARFDRRTGMVARFTAVVGGSWTLAGSYPPLVYPPGGGDPSCGPQVPVSCAGPVISRDRQAAMDFTVRGRRAVGYFSDFLEIVESARYAPPDPSRPFCSESGEEPTRVLPHLGLGGTSLAARAAPTPDTFPARVPVAKLLGRKRFSILLPPARLEACPRDYYSVCQESGSIRMRLTFTPAGRRPPA
jgi:hypothetical protein